MAANINIYVRERKVDDACGIVDYISNPDRQKEKLVAVVGNQDTLFWQRLAADCEYAFKGSEGEKCIQARELVVQVPNNFGTLPADEQIRKLLSLKALIDACTGTDCIIALHNSHEGKDDAPGNYHVHIIIPERQLLPEPEIIVAERNLFYDETGKRRYKKSDIFEDGELKPGCKLVPKGTVLHEKYFGAKNGDLKSQDWLYETKIDLAYWINRELEPDRKRVVFDKESSPLIPTFHVGKGMPAEKELAIKKDNEIISLYNGYVRSGLVKLEDAYRFKTLIMLSPRRADEIRNIFNQYIQIKNPNYKYQDKTAAVPRTVNRDPQKEELRALYKRSAEIWKQYREMDDLEYKKTLLLQGRAISAEIDAMKKMMGMWQMANYKNAVEKARQEAERWREEIRSINRYLNSFASREYYLKYRERSIVDEIWNERGKLFSDYGKIVALQAQLENVRQEQKENKIAWELAREEAFERKEEARRQYKFEKIKLKKAKQELREQMKAERQKKKDAKAFGLDAVLKDAAGRSGPLSQNTSQPTIQRNRQDPRYY